MDCGLIFEVAPVQSLRGGLHYRGKDNMYFPGHYDRICRQKKADAGERLASSLVRPSSNRQIVSFDLKLVLH